MERQKTILIVEDDPTWGERLSRSLQEGGYAIIYATDGESGWDEYNRATPDLVLLDRYLGISAEESLNFLKKIREKDVSPPVMIISGFPRDHSMDELLHYWDVEFFMEKGNFSREIFFKAVERLLSISRPLEQNFERLKLKNSFLVRENKELKEKIKQIVPQKRDKKINENVDKYEAIYRAVAHNLNGEFGHIGYSIKALRELAVNSFDIQEECDMIQRSVEYSQILLRRLLDYFDIGKPRLEPVAMEELLKRTESLVSPRLPSNIKLKIAILPNVKQIMVSSNIEQLMVVLLELIQNASNVLREKGGIIEIILKIKNNKVALSIKDDGSGIPENIKKNLFKKQVQSKKGLGIGLFLCNKVIAALGGKLNLESSSEKGTTFTILLPLTGDMRRGA